MTNKPLLLLFLGFPGSGKSSFAKQLGHNIAAVRLNGDAMKTAIYGSYDYIRSNGLIAEANQRGFSAIDYAVEEILRAGHSVIYDANNNKWSIREKLIILAEKYQALPIEIWVQAPAEVAKERATKRETAQDQPDFTETQYEESLARATANFDEPGDSEQVIKIDGTVSFDEQYESYRTQLSALGINE